MDNVSYQGGASGYTGTITLVPEPTTTLLHACALATLVLLRRRAPHGKEVSSPLEHGMGV